MVEFVRFMERPDRTTGAKVGTVHPLALAAMQQTGEKVSQQKGRGSQRFLQGGLSAPMTVTWEITAACNIACIHCLSASGRRRTREMKTEQGLEIVVEIGGMEEL